VCSAKRRRRPTLITQPQPQQRQCRAWTRCVSSKTTSRTNAEVDASLSNAAALSDSLRRELDKLQMELQRERSMREEKESEIVELQGQRLSWAAWVRCCVVLLERSCSPVCVVIVVVSLSFCAQPS
jgi:hypothetical protein